jgi:hypothetical protein
MGFLPVGLMIFDFKTFFSSMCDSGESDLNVNGDSGPLTQGGGRGGWEKRGNLRGGCVSKLCVE